MSLAAIASAIQMATKDMTVKELCTINIPLQLGADPRNTTGYEKVKHLFTDTRDGIPVAHEEVRTAFNIVVARRINLPIIET